MAILPWQSHPLGRFCEGFPSSTGRPGVKGFRPYLGHVTDVHDLLEKWGFGPADPPLPGRVASRLSEIIKLLRAAQEGDQRAVQKTLEELESLRAALELWTSNELDDQAMHTTVRDPAL